jgi:hypothetical protein
MAELADFGGLVLSGPGPGQHPDAVPDSGGPGRGISHHSGAGGDHFGAGYDAELLRMLCSPATVSEIAKRQYCSERSMYRRIRKLYNAFGVSGRSELHAKVAAMMPTGGRGGGGGSPEERMHAPRPPHSAHTLNNLIERTRQAG